MENKNTTSGLTRSSSILRIIGLLLVIISFAIFIYNTREQEDSLETKNTELVKKDSLLAEIEIQMDRTDTLKLIVTNYFKFRTLHNVDELNNFYADTVNNYFKNLKNCKKEEIKLSDKHYWSKYNKDIFYIKSEPEIILNERLAKAIIHGQQCTTENNCIDEIVEIQFDTKNKIKFVRAYFAK